MKVTLVKAWRGHKVGAEVEVDDAIAARLLKAGYVAALPTAEQVTPQPVSVEATVTPEPVAQTTEAEPVTTEAQPVTTEAEPVTTGAGDEHSPVPDSDAVAPGPGDLVGSGEASVTDAATDPVSAETVPAETVPAEEEESKRMRRRREAYGN